MCIRDRAYNYRLASAVFDVAVAPGNQTEFARIAYLDSKPVALFVALSHNLLWQQRKAASIAVCYCEKGGAFALKSMTRDFANWIGFSRSIRGAMVSTQTALDVKILGLIERFPRFFSLMKVRPYVWFSEESRQEAGQGS